MNKIFNRGHWQLFRKYIRSVVISGIVSVCIASIGYADTGPLNGTPDDVRVGPLLTTHWGQGSVGSALCYNYHTPLNRVCGCTATSLAQIMYYHRYPTERILPGEYLYDTIDDFGKWFVFQDGTGGMTNTTTGVYTEFNPPYGGPYEWNKMVDSPTGSTLVESRSAIGQLTRDAGLAVFSHYFSNGSTSGYTDAVASSIILNLHYADAVRTTGFDANKLIANLDAGLPVEICLTSSTSHSAVVDGYGYHDGKLYIHLNYGYGGSSDGWYDSTTNVNDKTIRDMNANIFPPTRGARHSSVISGRVLDESGNPVANVTVTAAGTTNVTTTSNANGIYAFILPAGNYTFTATRGSSSGTLTNYRVAASEQKTRAEFADPYNQRGWQSGVNNSMSGVNITLVKTVKQAKLKVSGYRRIGTIENFQALVKLSDGDNYGFSYDDCWSSDGSDLWFTDERGTLIPHDIDTWNTNGASFVWVKIPSLAYNTTITMHWGARRTQEQTCNPSDTWDGYVGVWHMNETGTTAEPDSTGHGLNAAPINNSSASTSINTDTNGGQIGNGRAVSQATMFKVSGHSSHISEAKTFTIGGWVKRTGSGDYPRIFVGNPNNSTRTKWEVYGWSTTELIARGGDKDIKRNVDLSTSAGWKYLTVVYTGTTATVYDNGAPVDNADAINNAVQDSYFTIGAVSGADNRSFVGTFDEVRMYNGALSADRIAADYATMHAPTEFITLDVPQQNEPDAYIEYVESDGHQWIDSGVQPGPTTSVTPAITSMIVDADVDIIGGNSNCDLVGLAYNNFEPIKTYNGKYSAYVKNAGETTSSVDINSGRHRVITTAVQGQPLSISVDGNVTTLGTVVANGTGGNTLYLFARKGPDRYCYAKLWGMKIYINGVIERDFVPGIKNGVAGLYDSVYDVWYVSQSGTALIAGPITERRNVPDAYLDYVKSTGTQWVSIGITPTQTMKFDVDVDWISGNTLIGQSNYGLCPLQVESGTIRSRWWMQDANASANTGVALDTGRRRFVITTSNSAYVSTSVDGGTPALSGGYSDRSGVNPSDLYLFARHFGGAVGAAGDYTTAKLYGLKIYGANGRLVCDYVPGIKDNVVGLYDRATANFVSSGSGTPLVAGPVVDRSKPDAFVEYVESNGSQWVDTGVDGRAGVKSEADIDWISGYAPLGVINSEWGHCLLLQCLDDNKIGGQAIFSQEAVTTVALNSGRHVVVSEACAGSKMTITVDGTTSAESPVNVYNYSTGLTIWMFAAHGGDGAWGEGNSKFYGLKLWRTGSDGVCRIQRHFIPCVKGGRAGLYDAVSGVIFYSHSGTDLTASSTEVPLAVWRNEVDDASLDNMENWLGNPLAYVDSVICAPWVPFVSSTNEFTFPNLTVSGGDLEFSNISDITTYMLTSDGSLTFTNLIIRGNANCDVTINNSIRGYGKIQSLTIPENAFCELNNYGTNSDHLYIENLVLNGEIRSAYNTLNLTIIGSITGEGHVYTLPLRIVENAVFKPSGTSYLQIDGPLSGILRVDISDPIFEYMTKIKLIKVPSSIKDTVDSLLRIPPGWDLMSSGSTSETIEYWIERPTPQCTISIR